MTREKICSLVELTRKVYEMVEHGGIIRLKEATDLLRHNGITANMHLGRGEEMKGKTDESLLLKFEWFLGQLIDLEERSAYFAINSWLNTCCCYLEEANKRC